MNNKKDRASTIRFERAKQYCINDILNGATASVLVHKLMQDDYNIGYNYSIAQAYRVVWAARDEIKKDFKEQLPTLLEDTYSRLLDVYTDAREDNDKSSALKALDQMSKLTGLYENKIKVEGDVNHNITIDFALDDNEE